MTKKPFGRAQRIEAVAAPAPMVRKIFKDLRRAYRRRMLLPGKVAFGSDGHALDCMISDISETGARICAEPDCVIPEAVTLVSMRDRTAYEATVAWRREDGTYGLKFGARHDLKNAATEEMKVLRRYCVEHDLRSTSDS
jgi:hypothetical protein